GRKVILAVNKVEGMAKANATAEFHELGLGEPHAISAAHGDGVHELVEHALEDLLRELATLHAHEDTEEPQPEETEHRIKLAIVGRPNVGKSTLVNTLLGEERVIAFDLPGTTRDAIEIDF